MQKISIGLAYVRQTVLVLIADPMIQAIGKLEFENGLRTGVLQHYAHGRGVVLLKAGGPSPSFWLRL